MRRALSVLVALGVATCGSSAPEAVQEAAAATVTVLRPRVVPLRSLTAATFERDVIHATVPLIIDLGALARRWTLHEVLQSLEADGVQTTVSSIGSSKPVKEVFSNLLRSRDQSLVPLEYIFGYRIHSNAVGTYQQPGPALFDRLPNATRISDGNGAFFIAGDNVDGQLHFDPELNSNLHTVLAGRKHFQLYTQDQSQYLHRMPLTAKSPIVVAEPESPAAWERAALLWPSLRRATVYSFWLEAGQALVMPPQAWHFVQYRSEPCVAMGVSFYGRGYLDWAHGNIFRGGWYAGFEAILGVPFSRHFRVYVDWHLATLDSVLLGGVDMTDTQPGVVWVALVYSGLLGVETLLEWLAFPAVLFCAALQLLWVQPRIYLSLVTYLSLATACLPATFPSTLTGECICHAGRRRPLSQHEGATPDRLCLRSGDTCVCDSWGWLRQWAGSTVAGRAARRGGMAEVTPMRRCAAWSTNGFSRLAESVPLSCLCRWEHEVSQCYQRCTLSEDTPALVVGLLGGSAVLQTLVLRWLARLVAAWARKLLGVVRSTASAASLASVKKKQS